MGVKPDHWIRRMALEHKMIEPFVEEQMTKGVISFGLSAYGYDIRVSDEFKVFTNVYNTVVDPKGFDEKSFVSIKADHCIIPPNSFALARTVEYFRIPRSVITLCVGKSTYARCFRGDTRVALVDGTSPTLEEMANEHLKGKRFWGYSIGADGNVMVTLLDNPRYIGKDSLLEVVLDNGESIFCTPDHRFMLRTGEMTSACELEPSDSLMPLYRYVSRDYEVIYHPFKECLEATYRLSDDWNIRHGIYENLPNTHRHHIDGNKANNAPSNITRMDATGHIVHHNNTYYGENFDINAHSKSIRDALEKLAENSEWLLHYREQQSIRARKFWNDESYFRKRIELLLKKQNVSEETKRKMSSSHHLRYDDPKAHEECSTRSKQYWEKAGKKRRQRQAEIARKINIRSDITADIVKDALIKSGTLRGASELLGCDRSVFRRFPEVISEFKNSAYYKNHKVIAIRDVVGEHDVYCLTVPEAGNFALEAGVFVQNCGIIVNVTPFEPEWEGFVTLEISNTTPLPAKIYANEGIAQVLFFEGDEICEVSYADKKGKYQKQTGITPPKV